MKNYSLLLLCALYAVGASASQPAKPVASAISVVAPAKPVAQKTGWFASLMRTARAAVHNGYQHATQAISYVRDNPLSKKVAMGAACAALGYGAIKLYERLFVAKVTTSDFESALSELGTAINCYNEQVSQIKEFLAFLAPAIKAGTTMQEIHNRRYTWATALMGGLTAGAETLHLMPLACSYPVDMAAWVLSYLPSPCFLNPLRASRLKKEQAWANIRHIIEEKKYTSVDVTRLLKQNREILQSAQMTQKMIDQIKSYAVKEVSIEKEDIWVSSLPQEVRDLLDQIQEPEMFKDVPLPKVVSLQGAPGTGKSLVAHYIGRQIGGYFKHYSPGNFYSKWFGDGEGFVRAAYEEALDGWRKTGKPSVIFVDEIENITRMRNYDSQCHGGEQASNSLLVEFFNQIDAPAYKDKIILVTASNATLASFDPAFRRRATYEIQLELPTEEEAFSLLHHEAAKYPVQMASLLQNNGEQLHDVAKAVVVHQFSRDGICKVITDAVRSALARGITSRKQLSEANARSKRAYEELIHQNPHDTGLHGEIQLAMQEAQDSNPIIVEGPELIKAFMAISAKEGAVARMPRETPPCLRSAAAQPFVGAMQENRREQKSLLEAARRQEQVPYGSGMTRPRSRSLNVPLYTPWQNPVVHRAVAIEQAAPVPVHL